MNLKNTINKKMALLGLGLDNYALIEFFNKHAKELKLDIFEHHTKKELYKKFPNLKRFKNINFKANTISFSILKKYDIIFKSPGVFFSPTLRKSFATNNIEINSAIKLFLELVPTKNIIGVSGTKGKGTTSSLIYHILKTAHKKVWLAGNIGRSPFEFIDKVKNNDWIIFELSSFQLQDIKTSPTIAVLTNFSPEHLKAADPNNPNHHPNLANYWQAKINIAKFQSKKDILIVNNKLKNKIKKARIKSKIFFFTKSKLSSMLPGKHNKENIAAATLVAKQLKISDKIIVQAVKRFKGLEHRLEKITVKKGVSYYNDSFATIPESTATALHSFKQPIILLAGGADKGSNFTSLAKLIKKQVKYLILFKGQGTDRILSALKKEKFSKQKTAIVGSMQKAMKLARQEARHGDIILLSPACASFGVFKNYKDRGYQFKRESLRL